MSTRAIEFLRRKGIPFSVAEYEHKEKGAKFASEALGFPIEKTVKTLVVDLGDNRYILVLMTGDKTLSTKKLSRRCSVKRTGMADSAAAERVTGYKVGGISPFGTTRRLKVVMDRRVLRFDRVVINAGKRGVMLMMDPADIARATDATVESLAEDEDG